jgi:hypothetical protein
MKKLNKSKKPEKSIEPSPEVLKRLCRTNIENIAEQAKSTQPIMKKLIKIKDCVSGLQKPKKAQMLNALIVVY